jgi:hypothetical protein
MRKVSPRRRGEEDQWLEGFGMKRLGTKNEKKSDEELYPKQELEINRKLLAIKDEILALPNMDAEFEGQVEYAISILQEVLIRKIFKYEYHLYYVQSKKRKAKRSPKKISADFQILIDLDSEN